MRNGTAVERHWIVVLADGTPVLDWGNGAGVDLMSGDILHSEHIHNARTINDDELDVLRRAGLVSDYDERKVFVVSLPEPPHPPLE